MKAQDEQAQGALYNLVHQKANALSKMKDLMQQLAAQLHEASEDEGLDKALALFEALDAQTGMVDQLDKRIAFLKDSGYEPSAAEAGHVALEMDTIVALLKGIEQADLESSAALAQARARLMAEMRQVREGQKSLQAYTPLHEESSQLDTFR